MIIENYVRVWSRVILLRGAELEDECIVQASAADGGKFPHNALIGVNPVRIINQRAVNIASVLASQI